MPRRWRHRSAEWRVASHVRTTEIVQSRGRLEGGSATVGRLRRRSPRFGEIRPADNSVPLREEFERRIAFLERVARARTRQTNKLIAIYTAPVPATAMQIPAWPRLSTAFNATFDYESEVSYPRNPIRRNRPTVFTRIFTDIYRYSPAIRIRLFYTLYSRFPSSLRGFRGILSERLGVQEREGGCVFVTNTYKATYVARNRFYQRDRRTKARALRATGV